MLKQTSIYYMILNSVGNLFLIQMPVILLLELCTYRRRMVKMSGNVFKNVQKNVYVTIQ